MNTDNKFRLIYHLHRPVKSIEPTANTLTTTHTLYIDNQEISDHWRRGQIYRLQPPQQAFVIRASKDVYYNDVIELWTCSR